MDLSGIIVNWNTRELVLGSVGSLFGAMKGLSTEILVVDNGSSDGSVEAVREAFPRVVVIQKEKNLGFARANNEALQRARGEYVLLVNTDVRLSKDTVVTLLEFMGNTPRAAVAGAQLLNPDGTKQNSFDSFPTLLSEGLNKSLLRILFPKRFPSKRLSFSSPVEVESVVGACMMVRRQAIDEVGPMDEGYFFFMEETDWCYRMRERGWKVYLVPQAEAVHLQGMTAGMVKERAKLEYYRSRYRFFKKIRGPFQARILAGILFLRLSLALVLQGLYCVVTLCHNEKTRRRLAISWKLFVWHVRLCPEKSGLKE